MLPRLRLFVQTSSSSRFCAIRHASTALPAPPSLKTLETGEQTQAARISGPGGQNVNKVNTKATVRCGLDSKWIPAWARSELRRSPSYVRSTDSLQVTSTLHRVQSGNVDDCLAKLHSLVLSAASKAIVNEPSEAQRERVKALERAHKARDKKEKLYRSALKKSRKSNPDW